QNCRLWRNVRFDHASGSNYAQVPGKPGATYLHIEGFDNLASLSLKLESIMSRHPNMCLALVDVDYDDFLGACDDGKPFARLHAVRKILQTFTVTAQFFVDLRKR
ncbi:unnamed protein product, partial [Ixodes hexagonus]